MSYIDFKSYTDIFPSRIKNNLFRFEDLMLTSLDTDIFQKKDVTSNITDDEWILEVELPGFKKEEINVAIEKNDYFDIISINANSDTKNKSFKYELKSNTFDYKKYNMSLELGVLKVQIPKIKDQHSQKKIELKF